MTGLLVTWLVTAVSLFIIAQLNIAIKIKSFSTALWAAVVFGLINGILGPIAQFLAFPLTLLTLGLFALVVNALLFGLAASLVDGFRLKNGFISALIGSILLSILNTIIGSTGSHVVPVEIKMM